MFPSTPATVLLHLSHASSQISHLTAHKLIFSVYPFVQLPPSGFPSPSSSVLLCVAAFHFVLLFLPPISGATLVLLLIFPSSASFSFHMHVVLSGPNTPCSSTFSPSHPFCFSVCHLGFWLFIDIPVWVQRWKYTPLQVRIDLNFIMPLHFSGCRIFSSLHTYNKAFLLHVFTFSSVFISLFLPLHPPLNWIFSWLVLFCRALGRSLWNTPPPTKTAFSFSYCVASTLHLLTTVPWKIQHVSLWRVAQDLGTFWGWFCLRCNGVCECQFYTEVETTSVHHAGT